MSRQSRRSSIHFTTPRAGSYNGSPEKGPSMPSPEMGKNNASPQLGFYSGSPEVGQVSDSYGGNTTATITDLNSGETASSTGASTGNDTQLYLGAEPDVTYEQQGPLVDYAIPKFTTAKFNDTVINGNEWSLSGPTAYSLEQNSDIQIKTASVPSAPAYSFALTEKHTK